MKKACGLLVFVVIGIIPSALGGYFVDSWQWWATCSPLWAGIALRDWGLNT